MSHTSVLSRSYSKSRPNMPDKVKGGGEGGGGMSQSKLFKDFFVCLFVCLEISDAGGGVLPKSNLVKELFCLSLDFVTCHVSCVRCHM